jgi:hypothetical protein
VGHLYALIAMYAFCRLFWLNRRVARRPKGQTLTEQILQIMETILLEASSQPHDVHKVVGFICFTAHDDFD